jgi:hypothetical protein
MSSHVVRASAIHIITTAEHWARTMRDQCSRLNERRSI